MKFFSIFFLAIVWANMAAGLEESVRIARFQDDKAAAVSYTFDDGLRDQFEIAAPMLNARGFHGTFFIIAKPTAKNPEAGRAIKPGGFGGISWPELRELAARGHEIGNHTWTHRDLRKLAWEEVAPEFDLADRAIFENVGVQPLTVAYTANSFDDRIRKEALRRHMADRIFQKAFGGPKFTEIEANTWLDDTLRDGKWGVAMIHGVIAGFYPFTDPEIFARHLDYAKTLSDRIWIDTFLAISNYIRTRDASTLEEVVTKPGEATFILKSHLPPSLEKIVFPVANLTVVLNAAGAENVTARRGNETVPARILNDRILVSVQPGPERVVILWK